VIEQPQSAQIYILIGGFWVIFWTFASVFFRLIFNMCRNTTYLNKLPTKKHEYMGYVVSIPHSTVSMVLSLYCAFFIW